MKTLRTLALAVLALLALVSVRSASAAARLHTVRIPAEALAGVENLRAAAVLDYGSFVWAEVEAPELQRLRSAGVAVTEVPDAGQVRVPGYRFDPKVEGEPTLAPELTAVPGSRGFHLVQVRGPAARGWLEALSASGLEVLQYYPHQTYLVWGGPDELQASASLPFVRWQGAFHPGYKIHSDVAGRSGRIEAVEVIFHGGGDVQATVDALAALGGEVQGVAKAQPDGRLLSAVAKLPAASLVAAAQLPEVLWMGYRSLSPSIEDEMSDQ
ncbi:MAG: hypothetical protein KDD47_15100, partial [Acidobacteria bacterium]|nr:hypothetical protein [Acidobacteriota bacterium]